MMYPMNNRRQAGGALIWIIMLVVILGLVLMFGDSVSDLTKSNPKTQTTRAAINEFMKAAIAFDDAAARTACKPGFEDQGSNAVRQLRQIYESHKISKPEKFTASIGTPAQLTPGEKLTVKTQVYGENKDMGATLTVIIELQQDCLWKVIEAYAAGAGGIDTPVIF